tara:strand:- start:630 stop:1034 length:405 start_codon:yes stop_codon:yes gene_type:complete
VNYKSIDTLPIYNYNKIIETGDFEKYGVNNVDDWQIIEREFFEQIGYSEKYFEILRIKTDIVMTKANYYKSNNNALKTLIEIKKAKLMQTIGEQVGGDFDLMIAQISKFMGFRIDIKKVSVKEFYSYIKLAEKQ